MSESIDESVHAKLERVASQLTRAAPGTARNAMFCFHMRDWVDDLQKLAGLMDGTRPASDEEWEEIVHGFLIHASGHILEAARLALVRPVNFSDAADGSDSSGMSHATTTTAAEPAR